LKEGDACPCAKTAIRNAGVIKPVIKPVIIFVVGKAVEVPSPQVYRFVLAVTTSTFAYAERRQAQR
jgi:hypothetical protein